MSFSLDKFIKLRPFLYHLTDIRNVASIRNTGRLFSATYFLNGSEHNRLIGAKRPVSIAVANGNGEVYIRDQKPLHKGNMTLEEGASYEQVIAMLNDKVFFWPGYSTGPISYGIRHFERYVEEKPALLKIDTSRLFELNSTKPFFCRYNSGSPRCTGGFGSPRGPKTFVSCGDAEYSAARVIECVYSEQVSLPDCTQIACSYSGPWHNLFEQN